MWQCGTRTDLVASPRGRESPNTDRGWVYTHTGGETTVARIVAELLHALGVLRTGQVVETDRADLVAGYVGQTALKVHEVVDCAMGQLHLSG